MLDLEARVKEEAELDIPYTEENIVFQGKDWAMIYVCSKHPKLAICRYFLHLWPGWVVKPDDIHIGQQVHLKCNLCSWGY